MLLLKKLIFAPLFLIVFAILIYQINPLLTSYDFIFSFTLNTLIQLITFAILISISSLLFSLLITLASDWKIALPVGIISAAIPFAFIPPALALILAVAIFVSLLLTNLNLDIALKSYLTFQPESILGPSIRHLSGFLILSFCLVYFFSANQIITQKGFQIPDSLIDSTLNMMPQTSLTEENTPAVPNIDPKQLELLKKNPEALRQSGLDPSILDTLSQPKTNQTQQNLNKDFLKQSVKDQVQNFIKPYINFIPAVLAVLLFLTLQSLTSMVSLLIYPILSLTFLILEKTGFVKFTTEMRSVKKIGI